MESAAIKTFDYGDVTVIKCLAAGASPVPSVDGRWIFKGIRRAKTCRGSWDRRVELYWKYCVGDKP